ARRGARGPHQAADPRGGEPAPRPEGSRAGARPAPHDQRQVERDRRARGAARPPGDEPRCAGEPRVARALQPGTDPGRMSTVRARLLRGAVDYAGLFPPAALDMDAAVAAWASYVTGPDRWALGRFVVAAGSLDAFARAAAPYLEARGVGAAGAGGAAGTG